MPIINKGIFDTGDAFLRQTGNDWPTAQVISTADVIESSSNLYFTNARVNAVVQSFLTTANVRETSGNLYFTNARVNAVVQSFLTTANVIESASNLYFTNARVIFAAIPAVTELTVTTPVFNYNIDQYAGDNPAIYVSAGETIAFNLNVSGSHPFNIRVSDGGSNYNTGLTHIAQDGTVSTESSAQGKVTGKLFWKIPYVLAGNTYVYQCSNHSSMVGSIVIQRLVSTITTDNVTEGSNLYFTNARVVSALVAGDNITIEANGRISSTSGAADLTTADVSEVSSNLYYTNARARSAFSAGRGILILDNGEIKTTVGSDLYSSSIDGVKDYIVTATMDNALVFPSTPSTDRFILRSLHITNISNDIAYISANVVYATGNIAMLATQIPVSFGDVVEFMGNKTQIFSPNDTIRLKGFDNTLTGAANKLSAYMTFETIPNDTTYVGVGETLKTSNNDIMIADMNLSASIFESIKFVNHKNISIPVRLTVTYANNTPKAYLAYNQLVPPQSSLEVLHAPKLLRSGDRLFARYDNASNTDSISVFSSYRLGSISNFVSAPGTLVSGNSGVAIFTTSISDGTTLYYTLE